MTATMCFDEYTWRLIDDRWVCDDASFGGVDIRQADHPEDWRCRRNGSEICRGAGPRHVARLASRILGEEAEFELAFEEHLGRGQMYARYSQIESQLRSEGIFDDFQMELAVARERSAFRAGYFAAIKRNLT